MTPNAYIAVFGRNAAGDWADHSWYCSEACATAALGRHDGWPEETSIDGLCCEREGCPVDDLG